jgi:hypothetical protein
MFQSVKMEKNEVRRMVEDIHANLTSVDITHLQVIANLEDAWPAFEEEITKVNLALSIKGKPAEPEDATGESEPAPLVHINEVDEKILALLCVNDGLEEEKIATTVYLARGATQQHLIELENKGLVWSNLIFGVRRWFITDMGKRYLPAYYQE